MTPGKRSGGRGGFDERGRGAEANRHDQFGGVDDDDRSGESPLAATDVRRRGTADEAGAGAFGDHGRIQRVVVVGVHRKHRVRRQYPEPPPGSRRYARFAGADPAPVRTRGSDGRVKNPSVNSADSPSPTSRVDTPAQVTVSALVWSAAGTANRLAWSAVRPAGATDASAERWSHPAPFQAAVHRPGDLRGIG